MAAPIQDFARVLKAIVRFARVASYSLIGLMVLFLGFRVADLYRMFAGMHKWGGVAFLVVFFAAFFWFIGRPIMRFLRMPPTIRPPALPPPGERTARDLARHLAFVERYVQSLPTNPLWEGDPAQVASAVERCDALRREAQGLAREDVAAFDTRMAALERNHVEPLLAPLDVQARKVIRQEALAVGIATAVSWNGTMDAFIVLWRNANLASRIARIYYGRPGARGTLSILRDVSAATLASAYLGDLTEMAGTAVGGAFGKTVGAFAGPLMEGGLNAVATLRIGYLAKARCRAFQAWNERTTTQAVGGAFKEAGAMSKDVVSEIIRTVGGGVLKLPGRLIGKAVDAIGGLWRPDEPPAEGAPAGAAG